MVSKLKFGSFFLTLIINVFSGILIWALFAKSKSSPLQKEYWDGESAYIASITVILLEILALYLLFKVKKIIVEHDKVIFKSVIFPFIKKERFFSYYDYSKLVEEHTKSGSYEALWLIKNDKLEDDISSFYYSNYTKLKFEIKVKNSGKLKIGSFRQLFCRLGMARV